MDLDVPRDRAGTLEPQLVRKGQRRLDGSDRSVIGPCARGLRPCMSAGQGPLLPVGDTGFEPVTSSVSGKRATTAPIARSGLTAGSLLRARALGGRRGGEGFCPGKAALAAGAPPSRPPPPPGALFSRPPPEVP